MRNCNTANKYAFWIHKHHWHYYCYQIIFNKSYKIHPVKSIMQLCFFFECVENYVIYVSETFLLRCPLYGGKTNQIIIYLKSIENVVKINLLLITHHFIWFNYDLLLSRYNVILFGKFFGKTCWIYK